ncbi:MAG: hypothetical protein KBD40_12175 [Phenylobacterium sp.]|nr:hypothetical protein [Phenylobacterium sp.]
MAIDWSLNRVPDFANAAMTGYNQGREQRQERTRNAALAQYAANPEGDLSGIIAADPALAIQLQAARRQQAAQDATLARQTETDTRERLARQQAATGQIFISLRNVAEGDRQAALVQMIQSRPDVWSPEEAQRAVAAFSQNKLDLSDARLDSLAQSRGVNPHEGDFTIGTGRYRAGATTPYARSQDPVITPFGIIPGAPATAPALSQEQIDKGMTAPLAAPPVAPATAAPGIASAPAPGGAPSPGVAAAPGPASGGTATPPPPASPPIALQDARDVVTSLGGHVTSGYRTPERNRQVRGAPNSYHIRGEGQAVDIRPIPGMTFQQFRQQLIDRGLPITELINEGDHWHWAFGQRGGNRRGGTAPVAPVNQTAPPPAPAPEGMDIGGGRRLIPMETPAQRLAAREAERRAQVEEERLRLARNADERAGRPQPVAQGRPLTPAERQQYPGADFMNPNGTPGRLPRDGNQPTPHQLRTEAVTLRRQFDSQPEVRQFNEVASSYETIRRLSTARPSPQNDIAVVYAFMRMLDPTSVVRETEYATAENARGVPESVRNTWNRILDGQRLTTAQRAEMARTAGTVYDSRRQNYDALVTQYQGYARGSGLPPDTIQARARPQNPRSSINPNAAQRQAFQREGVNTRTPAGSRTNPYVVNPADEARSYRAVPAGAWYVTPTGEYLQKGGARAR